MAEQPKDSPEPVLDPKWFDDDGKLSYWPMGKNKGRREPILDWLQAKFEKTTQYTEPEVKAILEASSTVMDHAYLRRILVETGRLSRTPYGDAYWRTEES